MAANHVTENEEEAWSSAGGCPHRDKKKNIHVAKMKSTQPN